VDLAFGKKEQRFPVDYARAESVRFVTVNRLARALKVDADVLVTFEK
jgi:hypothetical protein